MSERPTPQELYDEALVLASRLLEEALAVRAPMAAQFFRERAHTFAEAYVEAAEAPGEDRTNAFVYQMQ